MTRVKVPRTYSYDALDPTKREIRLVHLQPHSHINRYENPAPIECRIKTVNLDTCPEYEALSYEWGPRKSPLLPITLNGLRWFVRENLWWALYHLRQDEEQRVIWIDAICINQSDNAERNHQVAQMKSVYSSATNVVAWLEREQPGTHDFPFNENSMAMAMRFLEELGQTIGHPNKYEYLLQRSSLLSPKRLEINEKWSALHIFCRRTYWTRLWIIQEIVLAKAVTIQCGKYSIFWEVLSAVCDHFDSVDSSQVPELHIFKFSAPFSIDSFRRNRTSALIFGWGGVTTRLLNVLVHLGKSKCEDPRDKVFGLLSLSCSCCSEANPADYNMKVVDVATRMLQHDYAAHRGPAQNPLKYSVIPIVFGVFGISMQQWTKHTQSPSTMGTIDSDLELLIGQFPTSRPSLTNQILRLCPSQLRGLWSRREYNDKSVSRRDLHDLLTSLRQPESREADETLISAREVDDDSDDGVLHDDDEESSHAQITNSH